jgi:hypothetical protein
MVICPACPMLGVNLPKDWTPNDDESGVILPTFVMDGNFKADHMKMHRTLDDVAISDGHGFMVGDKRYMQHIKASKEVKSVSSTLVDLSC